MPILQGLYRLLFAFLGSRASGDYRILWGQVFNR